MSNGIFVANSCKVGSFIALHYCDKFNNLSGFTNVLLHMSVGYRFKGSMNGIFEEGGLY